MTGIIILMVVVAILIIVSIIIDSYRKRKVWCLMSGNSTTGYALHGVFSSPKVAEGHIKDHGRKGEWAIVEATVDTFGTENHVKFVKHSSGLQSDI